MAYHRLGDSGKGRCNAGTLSSQLPILVNGAVLLLTAARENIYLHTRQVGGKAHHQERRAAISKSSKLDRHSANESQPTQWLNLNLPSFTL